MTADDTARPEPGPTAAETVSLIKDTAGAEPGTGGAEAVVAPSTEPDAAEPEVAEPDAAEPEVAEPEVAEPEVATDSGATVEVSPAATVEIKAEAEAGEGAAPDASIEAGTVSAGPEAGATVVLAAPETVQVAPAQTETVPVESGPVEPAPAAATAPETVQIEPDRADVPQRESDALATLQVSTAPPAPTETPHQLYPPYPPPQWAPAPAAEPGPWRPAAPPPGPQRSFPTWIPITFAAVVAAAIIGGLVYVVVLTTMPKPADIANEAVTAAAEWRGATYRGSFDSYRGDRVEFDISTTGEGLRGTISRPGGAKAEVVKDRQGTLLRGNKAWWQSRYSGSAEKLADVWLSDTSELSELDALLKADPRALPRVVNINPQLGSMWRQTGEKIVDGVRALEITNGLHRLLVTADRPHRLIGIDLLYSTRNDDVPTRVAQVDAALVAQINTAAASVRGASPPKTVTQRLSERARLEVRIQPEPLCTTPTCSAVTTLTNSGELPGKGRIIVTADGAQVATHEFTVEPGKSVTFNEQAPNRHFNDPNASQFTIAWLARVLPSN